VNNSCPVTGEDWPLTSFTSLFMHGSVIHLAGNMLFLWIYGDNVEHRLGAAGYLLAYLGAGVTATAVQTLAAPHSSIPMIGASGAISGILGFYFVWFPRNQVRVLWLLPPFVMRVFEIPARFVLGFYLLADNLLPFLVARSEAGVAHGAHIGGFVAGLAAAWMLDRRALRERPRDYATATGEVDPSTLGRDIDAGQFAAAATEYFALPATAARGTLTPERGLGLADWLRTHGHPEAALTVLRRLLREVPRGAPRAAADVAAGRILLEDLGQPTSAYQYFRDALDHDPTSDVAPLARRALATIEATQKRQIGHLHRFRP
jgi:membrane associated rhomboid family serine protease